MADPFLAPKLAHAMGDKGGQGETKQSDLSPASRHAMEDKGRQGETKQSDPSPASRRETKQNHLDNGTQTETKQSHLSPASRHDQSVIPPNPKAGYARGGSGERGKIVLGTMGQPGLPPVRQDEQQPVSAKAPAPCPTFDTAADDRSSINEWDVIGLREVGRSPSDTESGDALDGYDL